MIIVDDNNPSNPSVKFVALDVPLTKTYSKIQKRHRLNPKIGNNRYNRTSNLNNKFRSDSKPLIYFFFIEIISSKPIKKNMPATTPPKQLPATNVEKLPNQKKRPSQ